MRTTRYSLKKRMDEVFSVEPNDLGFLTNPYHAVTPFLKQMPFLYIIPLSFLLALVLYWAFGPIMVVVTSMLQYGF